MYKSIHEVTSMKRAVLVGVGQMGKAHAKTVVSDDLANIELVSVCDCDVDRLLAFRNENPDIPVFLIPKNGARDDTQIKRAKENGIDFYPAIADIIKDLECDTLINVTHNNSHVPVLEDAFNARHQDGSLFIQTVFQEKPFAHNLAEAENIGQTISENNITFNLNGILTFSPIWNDFHQKTDALKAEGFQLKSVKCSYGKNRQQDTRPCQGGWVGMEAIHALDISTTGLHDIEIKQDSILSLRGFLAPHASEENSDGIVSYAQECEISAKTSDNAPVTIQMEGSYAWAEKNRRVQYVFADSKNNEKTIQLDFDVASSSGKGMADRMMISSPNGAPEVIESNADKLHGYYQSTLDPLDKRPLYDLTRAIAVQKTLENMAKSQNVQDLHSDLAPKKPKIQSISYNKAQKKIKHGSEYKSG
jgi:predicted dehydrogenase